MQRYMKRGGQKAKKQSWWAHNTRASRGRAQLLAVCTTQMWLRMRMRWESVTALQPSDLDEERRQAGFAQSPEAPHTERWEGRECWQPVGGSGQHTWPFCPKEAISEPGWLYQTGQKGSMAPASVGRTWREG